MTLKLNKLVFECIDDETGELYLRSLVGDDVRKWNEMMLFVCEFAENHNCNPKWHDLQWNQKLLVRKQQNVFDKLVEIKEESQSK